MFTVRSPNYSSIYAPPLNNITYHTYESVYHYSVWKLWIAYGITIGLTTVAVALGFIAMAQNDVSYSDNFSTVFRAAHGAELSVDLFEEDSDGKDPMPEYISTATVHFRGRLGSRSNRALSIDLQQLPGSNSEIAQG